MAATATERKLLLDGEWVETGDWVDVALPLRRRRSSAGSRRRARRRPGARSTPPSARCASRCPRTSGRRSSSASRARSDAAPTRPRADRRRGRQAAQGGAGRGRARDVDLHDGRRRGAEARGRDDPDGRLAGRRGQARLHACACRSASSARSRPFNFPLNLVAHKIAPALAAGCAVVLKPASQTPLSALLLAELEHGGRAAARLAERARRPVVARSATSSSRTSACALITFTGSGEVGWGIRERAPRKRVNLELGNATPVIVEADADLEDAAARSPRTRSRSPARAASPSSGSTSSETVYDAVPRRASCRGWRRSSSATPPTRRPTSAR